MRFLADESCDFAVVRALRTAGYDVVAVGEVAPGAEDEAVIDLAVREERMLLTEDKCGSEEPGMLQSAGSPGYLPRLTTIAGMGPECGILKESPRWRRLSGKQPDERLVCCQARALSWLLGKPRVLLYDYRIIQLDSGDRNAGQETDSN